MATTLANARIQLSREIGDYWASTVTTSSTGLDAYVDTALMAKANDWISDAPQEMYDLITTDTSTGTILNEERKISSLSNTAGTLTTLAHSKHAALGIGYEIHRLFSASEKRRALLKACKDVYPSLYKHINDTSKTTGNWLLNGDFEIWTSTTACTSWTVSVSTLTQTSSVKYYYRGAYSAKLSTAAGYLKQDWGLNDDLKYLLGRSVTFKVRGWCDTASCLRIGIYDGTTTTYSDYHDGNSAWAETGDEDLTVTAVIDHEATDVSFRIYHEKAAGISYVDDARVIGPIKDRIYIGDLGLAQNTPHSVEVQFDNSLQYEKWDKINNWDVDSNGYLLLPNLQNDLHIRIKGVGYLDFLVSGASSELWTATVAVDAPQLYILTAEAVMYLYTQLIMPNFTSGDRETIAKILQYWQAELQNRKNKYSMPTLGATISWSL
jgi:hypothetical protein